MPIYIWPNRSGPGPIKRRWQLEWKRQVGLGLPGKTLPLVLLQFTAGLRASGHRHTPFDLRISTVTSNPYIPILVIGAIGLGFAVFSVAAGALAGPKRYNRAKLDAYECGIEPSPQAAEGGRFPVKYFLTAMLFIIFDIEIVFLYPWAVAFDSLGIFGLVEMAIFIATVFVAFAYVWRRGGLEWD